MMINNETKKIKFMNINVDNVTMSEALQRIAYLIENTKQSYVVTPNVDHIVKLEKDVEFQEIYENADLVLTDGQPLIWISKLYKKPIKEKVSGADLFPKVCELAAQKGYTMFFLGAAEGVADAAAAKLSEKFEGLNVVGTYSPKLGFENDHEELQIIINNIKTKAPDILVVGLGTPKQEKFIYRNREKLNVPLALGLGASIDFEAGKSKRAPVWMSKCGLEWLYRLCKEPKRMFKRYLIDDMKIISLFLKYRKK
ncbi:MAG: WecB/TagA/CpsF family glycosyltransferase [Oscillospiraceae bacterium]|nr:WecB/TagA/CpsF family glycosyltransferase [Oscillospiraceae bacterium]